MSSKNTNSVNAIKHATAAGFYQGVLAMSDFRIESEKDVRRAQKSIRLLRSILDGRQKTSSGTDRELATDIFIQNVRMILQSAVEKYKKDEATLASIDDAIKKVSSNRHV